MTPKEVVEVLINSNVPFVLYRNPEEHKITLIVDELAKPVSLDNFSFTQKGFVFFPFDNSHQQGVYFTDQHKYELGEDEIDFSRFQKQELKYSPSEKDVTTQVEYESGVQKAVKVIEQEVLKKVVVAKMKKEPLGDIGSVINNLFVNYSNAFTYVSYTHQYGLWIGATPETLLKQEKGIIKTVALAGTQSAVGKDEKEAQWTQKEIEEQALVSRYIINCFKEIRLREFDDIGPKTVKAGNLFHLKTEFFINERDVTDCDTFGELVKLLQPTSAVCGMPLQEAKSFIKENENFNRKLFTGVCGPINLDDKSHLFVNLRCAQISGQNIYAYAGAGITIDSNPEKEWFETEMKCQTILSLLK